MRPCAMSATEEIGFLGDEHGFYFEGPDFGFRLRKAVYGCAYFRSVPETNGAL
jgi:hypothetical protein